MILPPGPQLALSSSLFTTLTCQSQPGASWRKEPVSGIRRAAMALTRLASLLLLSSAPAADASLRVFW
ncbi:hypothetical protein D3C76_1703280 [compost metagenome]